MENQNLIETKEIIIQRQQKYDELSSFTEKEAVNKVVFYSIILLSAVVSRLISNKLEIMDSTWMQSTLQSFFLTYSTLSPVLLICDLVATLIKKYKYKVRADEFAEILNEMNLEQSNEKESKTL